MELERRTTDHYPVEVPSPALSARDARRTWEVPLEFVRPRLSPTMTAYLAARAERGFDPAPTVKIECRGDRFFGLVSFLRGGPDLFVTIDCWATENRNAD